MFVPKFYGRVYQEIKMMGLVVSYRTHVVKVKKFLVNKRVW